MVGGAEEKDENLHGRKQIELIVFTQRVTMNVDEFANGWYWSRRHGEGGSHREYLATSRSGSAILINDDDWGLGAWRRRPETMY